MGWLDLFRRKDAAPPETKASSVGPLISARVLNMPQWPKRSWDQIAKEAYQQNPIVNAAVYRTTRQAAGIPLAIMKGDEEIEIPELRALLDRPNPIQDGQAFRQAVLSDLMLAGELFQERVDFGGKPKEIYRWSPGMTAIIPGANGFASAYEFKIGGDTRRVNVDFIRKNVPILHIKEYNPTDEWRGLPGVDACAYAIDAHTGAMRWNKALLDNGAQPSGALVYAPKEGPDKLSDEQFARLKAQLDESFSGAKNAGRPMLLDGGLGWTEMGFSPKDMNFGEGLHASARLIALAFGVPPLVLGIPGDSTYANYQEANKAWHRELIIPLLAQWCRAMTWWIGDAYGSDIRIEPDTDDLEIFADERAAEWDRIEKSTVMKVNEKREKLGLDDDPAGDVILVPGTMVPLEAASTAPDTSNGEDDTTEEDDTEPAGPEEVAQ